MTVPRLRAEMVEIEKACMALRATGGTRFRKHFKMPVEALERYAAGVPGALKLTMLHMFAGQAFAEKLGKAAELETFAEEFVETVLHGPPGKAPPKGQTGAIPREPEEADRGTGRGADHGI